MLMMIFFFGGRSDDEKAEVMIPLPHGLYQDTELGLLQQAQVRRLEELKVTASLLELGIFPRSSLEMASWPP